MPVAEQSLVETLNRRCQCVGTDVAALRAWLDADLTRRGVSEPIVASHPHLFSELPVFVAHEQVVAMHKTIAAVEAVVRMPAYVESVLERAPAIAQHCPAARGVFLGYDFHLSSGGPKLIEINTNAGGALLNVAMARAQHACCPEVARYVRTQSGALALEDEFFAMFMAEWRLARGERELRRVAIVDESPRQQYLYPEFLLFQQLFAARGVSAVIAAPHEIEYRNGALWVTGQRIDMIYNRLTDFYLQSPAHSGIARAYLDDAVVLTPHPQAHALYANKHNLTLLTDATALRSMSVSEDVIATLLAGIPRTLPVRVGESDCWWTDRKQWFFKPAGGYGSRGAYRGDKLTRKSFAELVTADYVAQRIAPPGERWLSEIPQSVLKFDVRNYAYDGVTQLMAARLYQGQTTNFRTNGGGFAPVYALAAGANLRLSAA